MSNHDWSNTKWWRALLGPGTVRDALASSQGVFASVPDGDGWNELDKFTLPQGVLFQFRYSFGMGEYVHLDANYVEDLSPRLNRSGLQWRMTGIGREQIEARAQLKRSQEERHAYGA